MSICRTEAIVLRDDDWRETSSLLTLYTRDYGMIKAVAKGFRAKKGRGWGGLNRFSENEIIFYHKKSGLHLIDKWSPLNTNNPLMTDLKKLVLASSVCELIGEYTAEAEKNVKIYSLLCQALKLLAEKHYEDKLLIGFMVQFLHLLGYRPSLDSCSRCRRKMTLPLLFALNKGRVICQKCRRGKDQLVIIDARMRAVIDYLQDKELVLAGRLKMDAQLEEKIRDFLILFLSYSMGREIKSISFLRTAKC